MNLLETIDSTVNQTKTLIKRLKEEAKAAKKAGLMDEYAAKKAMLTSFEISSKHYSLLLQQCKGVLANQDRTIQQQNQRLQVQRNEILRLSAPRSEIIIPH